MDEDTLNQALAEIDEKKKEALAEIDEYAQTLMPYVDFAKVALQVDINTEDIAALHRIVDEGLPANEDAALAGKVSTNSDNIDKLQEDLDNLPQMDIENLEAQVDKNTRAIANLQLSGSGSGSGSGGSVPDSLADQVVKNSDDISDLMDMFNDFLVGES